MTTRWVVGVDGSPAAERALAWCIAQAPAHAANIRVVRAWQPNISGSTDMGVPLVIDPTPDLARHELDELAERLGPGETPIEFGLELGGASAVLLAVSAEADLLAVGTRGLGGFRRLLLGSVSHQCATRSTVPVAVVPEAADVAGRLARIVVGMDGSANAKAALGWALSFAPSATEVQILGVWEPTLLAAEADPRDFGELSELAREKFDQAIDKVEALGDASRSTNRSFLHDHPAAALVEAAEGADLLVVGARGHGAIAAAILGSVSTSVLQRALCPVVVVPSHGS